MERRQKISDDESFIKHWTSVLDPIRFRQVYLMEEQHDQEFRETPGHEVDPSDFEDIDQYLRSLDKTRVGRA